ncbi:anti-sigma F factor [Thermaerobacter subterraneus DSM 13965]|uniref:Anti-sigma F factor n=1 Tax=Thermaerobacter subterraneus DSM 13965 TaxID=867903 RepID=K6NYA7_9FIRM|nr:anti-sigma F factor [Thermaerobacter subterraneus DSM 13965]
MSRRATAPRWLELRLSSQAENVGVARVAVAAFAAQLPFTLSELEEIKVAVSEAVTNAVVHGYGHDHGVVTVRAGHDGRRLWVEVADSGRGIADIEQARQPAFSTDPERMGMGFAFMEAFMDQVDVESVPGAGTTVRMYKRPRPQEGSGTPGEPARPAVAGPHPAALPSTGAPPSQAEAAAGRVEEPGPAGPAGGR